MSTTPFYGVNSIRLVVVQDVPTNTLTLLQISALVDPYFQEGQAGTKPVPDTNTMVCALNTSTGKTEMGVLTHVTRLACPTGTHLKSITTNSGKTVVLAKDTAVARRIGNAYTFINWEEWQLSGNGLMTSLYLPTRIAGTGKVFSVNVEMQTSAQDPQTMVPITTNTWGELYIPFQLIDAFEKTTFDIDDKYTLSDLKSHTVTYNPIESISDHVTETDGYVYTLTTTLGNFMLGNGAFISSTPVEYTPPPPPPEEPVI